MMLDDQGRDGVFAFLQSKGYTGTLEDWWAEVRRQSYASEVRIFEKVWLPSLGENFQEAQTFLRRVLHRVKPHFDAVRIWDSVADLSIDFNKRGSCRQEATPRPLRLDGLSIDIQQRNGQLEVRFRLYVNNEFRRDRYFIFNPSRTKRHKR